MIDIHNHIIYACDDGAKTINDSVNMIKAAKEVGINKICFTPHYMEDGYKSEKDELQKKLEIIKGRLEIENIKMDLFLGEEVFIFPTLDQNLDSMVTLNNSKYILFELPLLEELTYVEDVVYKLFSYGKTPVLAHPERYLVSQRNFAFLEDLFSRGVLFQINASSVLGDYGKDAKKLAIKLLKNNMVHFISSDAHSANGYKNYGEGIHKIKKIVGDKALKELTETNPQKVLNNEEIDVFEYEEREERKKFFIFGGGI